MDRFLSLPGAEESFKRIGVHQVPWPSQPATVSQADIAEMAQDRLQDTRDEGTSNARVAHPSGLLFPLCCPGVRFGHFVIARFGLDAFLGSSFA